MIVGVPKEIKAEEYRVAMLPVGAEELTQRGPSGVDRGRRGAGERHRRRPVCFGRCDDRRERRGDLGRGRHDRQGQGAADLRVVLAPARPGRLHLLSLRGRREPHACDHRQWDHGDRLRDAPRSPWQSAALDADERGRRPDEHPGGGQVPRAASGRPGNSSGRRAGSRAGRSCHSRWRRGRLERGQGRRRAGSERANPRHQPRPAPLPRRHHAAQRHHALFRPAHDSGVDRAGRPRDRRRADHRRPGASTWSGARTSG